MNVSGIYPVSGKGPQLSDREAALLASLPATARRSRLATHAELSSALVALAKRDNCSLDLDVAGAGFTAVLAGDLRVVANVRGTGEETFYCQASDLALVRRLAEEIARTCGPQLVLPSGDDVGVLVIAPN